MAVENELLRGRETPKPVKKPYVYVEYPKAKYHADGKQTTIVRSREEEDKLGPEWGSKPVEAPPEAPQDSPEMASLKTQFDFAYKQLLDENHKLVEENGELKAQVEAFKAAQPPKAAEDPAPEAVSPIANAVVEDAPEPPKPPRKPKASEK